MAENSRLTTPLTRALLRVVLLLIAVSWTLSAAADKHASAAAPPPCNNPVAGRAASGRQRPVLCERLYRFGLDYLDDAAGPHHPSFSFDIEAGELQPGRSADFHAYVLSPNLLYFWDVTFVQPGFQARVRAPQGGGDVSGTLTLAPSNVNGPPCLRYRPCRQPSADRIAFVDVTYDCRYSGEPPERARWMLTLVGSNRAAHAGAPRHAAEPAAPPPAPPAADTEATPVVQARGPASADSASTDIGVSLVTESDEITQGEGAWLNVTVTNHGPNRAADVRVPIAWTWGLMTLVPNSTSQGGYPTWGWREGHRFNLGPLESGASASLRMYAKGHYPGAATVSASASDWRSKDPMSANDRAKVTINILPAAGPDLVAAWLNSALVVSGHWSNQRATITGKVRVSYAGTETASPTRLAFFLSLDEKPGPEDVFLGFREAPALLPGGSVDIEISEVLCHYRRLGRQRLLVYVDSSNSVAEVRERNNVAATPPLP